MGWGITSQPAVERTQRRNALPPLLLAIEVLSPEQTVPEMIRRANRYIDWGVSNVWLVEPQKQFAIAGSNATRQPVLVWPGFDLQVGGLSISLADLLS
jgi:Uma2 family endonuclease